MLVWLTLPFYDFCGFRSVAVNSVYKLQFFYIYYCNNQTNHCISSLTLFSSVPYRIIQGGLNNRTIRIKPHVCCGGEIGIGHWVGQKVSHILSLLCRL